MLLPVSDRPGGGRTFSGGCADFQGSWDAWDPLITLSVAHCD